MAVSSETKTVRPLTGELRAEFLRKTKACANADQVKRITARLSLIKFVNEHTLAVCQATHDDILKRAKR